MDSVLDRSAGGVHCGNRGLVRVFSLLFALMLGHGLSYALSQLTNIGALRGVLWIGPIGAVVGALLWLIARPDRTYD